MSARQGVARSLLVWVALLGGLAACGSNPQMSSVVQRDLDVDGLLTVSSTDTSFAVTFSGDDAGLSFVAAVDPISPSTTGGGWIAVPDAKASFGFMGAISPDGSIRGNLSYDDHEIGLKVKSSAITSFAPGCTSTITGFGTSSSGAVTFEVTATDAGEPGPNGDSFCIQIPELGYSRCGTLEGGNIQAHLKTCP